MGWVLGLHRAMAAPRRHRHRGGMNSLCRRERRMASIRPSPVARNQRPNILGKSTSHASGRRFAQIETPTDVAEQISRNAAIGLLTKTSGEPLDMVIAWRNDCS